MLRKVLNHMTVWLGKEAPDFIDGIWLNSQPYSLKDINDKILLIEFWDYSCINCIRTLPYMQAWYEKYSPFGLLVIGVHTPEFEFGKEPENINRAISQFRIKYPVVLDAERTIWHAYNNFYWPRIFIIDKNGIVRYDHVGEGAYYKTETKIQELLRELKFNINLPDITISQDDNLLCYPITKEIYLGFEKGYIGNEDGFLAGISEYSDSPVHIDGKYYLQGLWLATPQYVKHARKTSSLTPSHTPNLDRLEDYVAIKYHANEVNAVMCADLTTQVFVKQADNWLDNSNKGKDIKFDEAGRSYVEVSKPRIYNLVNSQNFGMHELRLFPIDEYLQIFTFSFGSIPIL
ncbi:MAG: redoxin domain-containing protein [Thermoplasmata archaeon]